MERNSLNNFISQRIISSFGYRECNKDLSFSYKEDNNNDEAFACIYLVQENLNIENLQGQIGCQVLGYWCNDIRRLDQLFEEAENRIAMWINNDETSFDYIWFDSNNYNFINLTSYFRERLCFVNNFGYALLL